MVVVATVSDVKSCVVVVVALVAPPGTRIRAGLLGERVSSMVSSTLLESELRATSTGASSTTTGGAMAILATWITRTHAAVAVAKAIARRIKVPTPIAVVPVGSNPLGPTVL